MMQTVTSSEFNRQIGKMKQASFSCPVVITEKGETAYVLLSFEHYEKLIGDTEQLNKNKKIGNV